MPLPVTAVAPVHEHVDNGTEEQERVGDHAQQVRPVLLPEKEHGNRHEQAHAQPPWHLELATLGVQLRSHVYGLPQGKGQRAPVNSSGKPRSTGRRHRKERLG